ncbi:hypothetical protein Taro_007217, partial [Colocasia esculenta]|nr:hypothetical protein [Colocasia esculenta]
LWYHRLAASRDGWWGSRPPSSCSWAAQLVGKPQLPPHLPSRVEEEEGRRCNWILRDKLVIKINRLLRRASLPPHPLRLLLSDERGKIDLVLLVKLENGEDDIVDLTEAGSLPPHPRRESTSEREPADLRMVTRSLPSSPTSAFVWRGSLPSRETTLESTRKD